MRTMSSVKIDVHKGESKWTGHESVPSYNSQVAQPLPEASDRGCLARGSIKTSMERTELPIKRPGTPALDWSRTDSSAQLTGGL